MVGCTRAESRLRARADTNNRPLSQLTAKERGLRAASECIKGTLSDRDAQDQYAVDRNCLSYYKKKLITSGFAEVVQSVQLVSTPAAGVENEPPTTGEQQSTGK